jgi:hypothetical protein
VPEWHGNLQLWEEVIVKIPVTDKACRRGGILTALVLAGMLVTISGLHAQAGRAFRRIASIPVFLNTDVNLETVAEIVAASDDGNLLVYTDSETENLGFVDITDPYQPVADGVVALAGEPTSVAVRGRFALVAVNTSPDFVNPSGVLQVIDINSRAVVTSFDLGGQPDSVAVSPDRRYAAIAIENERDEDLGDGRPPQAPPGFVVIFDIMSNNPAQWSSTQVELVGIPDKFPNDPEPEFVSINRRNKAVVTLQENNHIVIIDLKRARVDLDFPAGNVDLSNVDTLENELIEQNSSLKQVPREPDAVVWLSTLAMATADEGDLDGGSRGFTIFGKRGWRIFEAGSEVENVVTRHGHYPEERSENKGNEPEGVAFGSYHNYWWFRDNLLFVGSERSSVVLVYKVPGPFGQILGNPPELCQVLPCGVGPEGLLPIPQRDLFVVASEVDERDNKIRSAISIYKRMKVEPDYPRIASIDRSNGLPIPWGALSGLSSDPFDAERVYTIYDSFYRQSRIFSVQLGDRPALIDGEIVIRDTNDVLITALNQLKSELPGTDDFIPADLVNPDKSVNLDPEGIVACPSGGFWIDSEGFGNLVAGVSDPANRPFQSPNMLIRTSANGLIEKVVFLPLELTRNQLRFGFEGVTVREEGNFEVPYVTFQREWTAAGDPAGFVRIGRYDCQNDEWTFALYPLDTPTSPNGGWVGNSELTWLGDSLFLVIERDNQGGPDAAIKRVYEFSIDGVNFLPDSATPNFPILSKSLVRDLIADGDYAATGGLALEKLEGLAVLVDGTVIVVNDNDGVDDNSGETQLFRFPLWN